MEMAENLLFYKKNVPYRVGVRRHIKDHEGVVLSDEYPVITIDKSEFREFVLANKLALNSGLIIQVEEPPLDDLSPNAITDEDASEIVKNFFGLKKRLQEVTSEAVLIKLLNVAKAEKRSEKVIGLIMERYEEISPNAMVGVE